MKDAYIFNQRKSRVIVTVQPPRHQVTNLPAGRDYKETFAKHQYCHCERSEAISQHVDNPRDCFVASLLAMTKTAVMQRSPFEKHLETKYSLVRTNDK